MNWLSRMFGKRADAAASAPPQTPTPPPAARVGSSTEPTISRPAPDRRLAAPGEERATYLSRVALVFGGDEIDAAKSFQDYGFDELDVSECVLVAEQVWAVRLMPNPMNAADFADMARRFPNLSAIMSAAESAAPR